LQFSRLDEKDEDFLGVDIARAHGVKERADGRDDILDESFIVPMLSNGISEIQNTTNFLLPPSPSGIFSSPEKGDAVGEDVVDNIAIKVGNGGFATPTKQNDPPSILVNLTPDYPPNPSHLNDLE